MYTYVLSADLGWRMAILPKKLETQILLSFLMLSRFLMDYYISYTYTMHYFILFISAYFLKMYPRTHKYCAILTIFTIYFSDYVHCGSLCLGS